MSVWGDVTQKVPKAYDQMTGGNVNDARVGLIQAQTAWWKQKHTEVMAALQAKERTVGAQQAGAMQRAYLSARTRLQSANMSNDAREYIAMQTAMNTDARTSFDQAFTAAQHTADQQFSEASSNWRAEAAIAAKGPNPNAALQALGPPPQASQFTVNMPASAPPTIVMVPTADGRKVPVVQPRLSLPPITEEIRQAKAAGVTDLHTIRDTLHRAGYSQQQIDQAIPLIRWSAPSHNPIGPPAPPR